MSSNKLGKSRYELAMMQSSMVIDSPERLVIVRAMEALDIAKEMYEENSDRAELIGQVYVLLQQGMAEDALNLIHEREVISFETGNPIAVSSSLSKARGETK